MFGRSFPDLAINTVCKLIRFEILLLIRLLVNSSSHVTRKSDIFVHNFPFKVLIETPLWTDFCYLHEQLELKLSSIALTGNLLVKQSWTASQIDENRNTEQKIR